jgi:hypothetical protein
MSGLADFVAGQSESARHVMFKFAVDHDEFCDEREEIAEDREYSRGSIPNWIDAEHL